MKIVDYLQPDIDEIRHQIMGILDSYSHEWDVIAELSQNAIDAIREAELDKGRIRLEINSASREVTLSDNGVGIDPSQVAKLLRPFATNKASKPGQIGEKGVGLKFVIFSSSHFEIQSKNVLGSSSATLNDASAWLNSTSDEMLPLEFTSEKPKPGEGPGTTIRLKLSDADHPIFGYSFEELLYLLRTKTAIGDTGYLWDDPLNCDCEFIHFDKGGKRSSKTFDCRYFPPTEPLKGKGIEDLDAFQEWLASGDHTDAEKRRKLLKKIVFTKGKRIQSGREIRYWSCFVPGRDSWEKLNVAAGLKTVASTGDSVADEHPEVGFAGGFQTSTKGMPTGISLELRPRGAAGYLPNFFMLVDDPSLKFDIGRKAVHGRQQGVLKELAQENFREYLNRVRKYVGGDIDPEQVDWDRDEIFAEINALPDLDSAATRFVKRPNAQEATVAALFFEQIGKGQFPELRPLVSGYKNRYDLYALWQTKRVVIEFKYDLAGLLSDFNEERKMFNEINAVVLWEVTENDRTLVARRGMVLEPTEDTALIVHKKFPHAQFKLILGDTNPMYVVEMKRLIDE